MSLNTPSYQLKKESKASTEFQNDLPEQQTPKEYDDPKRLLKDAASHRTQRYSTEIRQPHHHNRILDICSKLGSKGNFSEENVASKIFDSSEKQMTLFDFMASLDDMQLGFMKSFLESWSQNDKADSSDGARSAIAKKEPVSNQQQQYQEIFDFFEQNNLDISNINAFNSKETIVLD